MRIARRHGVSELASGLFMIITLFAITGAMVFVASSANNQAFTDVSAQSTVHLKAQEYIVVGLHDSHTLVVESRWNHDSVIHYLVDSANNTVYTVSITVPAFRIVVISTCNNDAGKTLLVTTYGNGFFPQTGVSIPTAGLIPVSECGSSSGGPPPTSCPSLSTPSGKVEFVEAGLPSGTQWQVTFNGQQQSGILPSIVFTAPPAGNYSWNALTPITTSGGRFVAVPSSGIEAVPQALAQCVLYLPQYYLTMEVSPPGVAGVSPGSGWYTSGTPVTISMVQTDNTYTWSGWVGTGTVSYTGTNVTATITMDSNITEIASFSTCATLVVGSNGGSIHYYYGSTKGVVPAGKTAVVCVPAGTVVTLDASPNQGSNEKVYWVGYGAGSYTGPNNPIQVLMQNSLEEEATFK